MKHSKGWMLSREEKRKEAKKRKTAARMKVQKMQKI